MNRFVNSIKTAWWAWKNPSVLTINNFRMLSDLHKMIMQVATENRHRMTHIAYIHPTEGEKQIVSIWAGAGMAAEPTKRIAELLEENSKLKAQLAKQIDSGSKS